MLLFNRNAPALVGALSPANFRLFATPAINLFEKQLGRVQVNGADHEFLLMPDRTRPLDFEVWRILDVSAHLRDSTDARPVAPLYALGALLYDWRDALFFVPRLKLRRLSTREQRRLRREDYTGTETWISLTAAGNPERIADIKELAVRALVTNRELASKLAFRGTEHFVPPGGPVRAVSILRSPSRPRPPLGLDDAAWRIIAHLTPNYATLVPEDGNDPSMLRDHLALYGPRDNAALRRQIGDPAPELAPREGVGTAGRFVQKEDVRLVQQRRRHRPVQRLCPSLATRQTETVLDRRSIRSASDSRGRIAPRQEAAPRPFQNRPAWAWARTPAWPKPTRRGGPARPRYRRLSGDRVRRGWFPSRQDRSEGL
ncbi:MAG: hypothetical protein B7X92_04350 [Novosphingobium sp. 17-62-9]|nr:MAG: hypothetical protein B7X92_04350 [Novosphingobium sp. 17-62-9]